MKDHNLLQAICRVNRPYPEKSHGLIVDYLGIFDDVARALNFDEAAVRQVISNIDTLKEQFIEAMDNDIASIVRVVQFDGWQNTSAGEREVKKALRKTLMKYKLHTEHELFDKAYGYIREYY